MNYPMGIRIPQNGEVFVSKVNFTSVLVVKIISTEYFASKVIVTYKPPGQPDRRCDLNDIDNRFVLSNNFLEKIFNEE